MKYFSSLLLILLFPSAFVFAQNPQLLKDIYKGDQPSNFIQFEAVDTTAYFVFNNELGDYSLYKSDGTEQGTILLLQQVNYFFIDGEYLYCSQRILNKNEYEYLITRIHRTTNEKISIKVDALTKKIFLLKNEIFGFFNNSNNLELVKLDFLKQNFEKINSFKNGTQLINLFNINENMMFTINNNDRTEVWRSDGTSDGTFLLNLNLNYIREVIFWKNNYYLYSGRTIWKTDGTKKGTISLAGSTSDKMSQVASTDNFIYFIDWDSNNLYGIKDTTFVPIFINNLGQSSNIELLSKSKKAALYKYKDANKGWKIIKTDKLGTKTLYEGGNLTDYWGPEVVVQIKDSLWIKVKENENEWIKIDTAFQGVNLKADEFNYSISSKVVHLSNLAYFGGIDLKNGNAFGYELYVSDGTKKGTKLVKDINALQLSSHPNHLNVFNNKLFLVPDNTWYGYEPWISDGTPDGTHILKNLNERQNEQRGAYYFLANMDNKAFLFSAEDCVNGGELWISDGTTNGTNMVMDFAPFGSSTVFINQTYHNGRFYFCPKTYSWNPLENKIWQTDGTASGTDWIRDLEPTQKDNFTRQILFAHKKDLYFIREEDKKKELMKIKLNDTNAKAQILHTLDYPEALYDAPNHVLLKEGQYFLKFDENGNIETKLLIDSTSMFPNVFAQDDYNFLMVDFKTGKSWIFNAEEGKSYPLNVRLDGNIHFKHKGEFYISYDKKIGKIDFKTKKITDLAEIGSNNSNFLGVIDNKIVFYFVSPDYLNYIFSLDLLTQKVENLRGDNAARYEDNNNKAAIINGIMYFNGYSKESGVELWQTDGTAANTKMVADIKPGVYSSKPTYFFPFNEKLYFIVAEEKFGREMWVYDPNIMAIKEYKADVGNIKIYPNPSNDLLNIELSEVCKKVSVFDVNGKKMLENQELSTRFSLPTLHFINGMYFIYFEFENGEIKVQKVVIQH